MIHILGGDYTSNLVLSEKKAYHLAFVDLISGYQCNGNEWELGKEVHYQQSGVEES